MRSIGSSQLRQDVETMTVARWRQLHVWEAQKTAIDRDMAQQNNGEPATVRVLLALQKEPRNRTALAASGRPYQAIPATC